MTQGSQRTSLLVQLTPCFLVPSKTRKGHYRKWLNQLWESTVSKINSVNSKKTSLRQLSQVPTQPPPNTHLYTCRDRHYSQMQSICSYWNHEQSNYLHSQFPSYKDEYKNKCKMVGTKLIIFKNHQVPVIIIQKLQRKEEFPSQYQDELL